MNHTTGRPVLLVCGCRIYEDYLHAALRRMDHPEFELIGVLGSTIETGPSFNPETRILTLPVPDTYEALPIKIHAAFAWIHRERPGIPGIFKTDDDMSFDMSAMVKAIYENEKHPYGGLIVGTCNTKRINLARINSRFSDKRLRPTHQSATYCSGAGYWISASTLPILIAAADEYRTSCLEDVCTGYVLNRAGILPVPIVFAFNENPRTPELLALK